MGKHPRTQRGFKDATIDEAKIRRWWNRWPDANVGIRTGAASGLVVLDVDPRNGGAASLEELEREFGELPMTETVETGGGGQHVYFKHSGGEVRTKHDMRPGLDLQAEGAYVVGTPSLHASGRRYVMTSPMGTLLASPPVWLLTLAHADSPSPDGRGAVRGLQQPIREGRRNRVLVSVAGSLRSQDADEATILAALKSVNAERCEPPLPEADLARMAASIGRKPVRCRREPAQGQAVAFKDLLPWPETVRGDQLLNDLVATFRRFLALQEGVADALALWTLHAHVHNAAQVSPILVLSSPEKRCGKSTALLLLHALAPRALLASNITSAALFRTVEKFRPTLLVDEADTFIPESQELRGILNSGHFRASATVVRTAGDDHEPRTFSTWAPKAIALIGALPATLEDRALKAAMHRRAPTEQIEPVRLDRLGDLEPLHRRAVRWASDNLKALRVADPPVPPELNDRAADNWRPLLAIADLAGEEWAQRARIAALLLSRVAEEGDSSARILLLADLQRMFDEDEWADKLASADIVKALNACDDRPWPGWNHGKGITAQQVAKLLKPFGVSPKSLRFEDGTRKGYYRPDLRDAFARYLPPRPEQAEQVSTDASAAIVGVRNSSTGVPARGSPEEPHPACSVPPVPAQGGGSADAQALVHPQLDLDLDLDLDPGTAARLAKGWEPLGGWGSRAEEGES